jgi:thiol-disulfide isomerase/thioredoxin
MNMSPNRQHLILIAAALSGAMVLSSACASKTKPAGTPAAQPAAPVAAAPSAAPAATAPAAAAPATAPAAAAPATPRPPAPAPLLGHVTREQLRAYESWKPLFVEPYVPDAAAVTAIRTNADGITVLLVVATWCPDSKREVPRFFAIMDGAGIRESQLKMVGVDRTKKDAEGLTDTWGVTRVPTFVFLRNGQEVGRVVERTPAGATLEGEIARILAPRL